MFERILVQQYSDFRYAGVHRLTVDAYALQHPEIYMVSPKSYAAHLTGMCCAMEYGDDPILLRSLQQWLNGRKQLEKPGFPEQLGALTIAHVARAEDPEELTRRVQAWAADIWQAYSAYHGLAREWIKTARRDKNLG